MSLQESRLKMKNLNRAEFEIGSKVKFVNGKKLINTVVTNVTLNPIDNIIEYRLFYREEGKGSGGKRNRIYVTTTPYFIKESIHFKGE